MRWKRYILLPLIGAGALIWSGDSHLKSSQQYPLGTSRLVHVQIYHRHGDRTPLGLLHSDHTIEKNNWLPKINTYYSSPSLYKDNHNKDVFLWSNISKKLNYTHLINTSNNQNEHPNHMKVFDSHYPYSWMGQLTNRGIEQLDSFGKYLRKRYVYDLSYLSPNYDSNNANHYPKIEIYSTNFARTIYSVDTIINSLYPESSRKGNGIPIHIEPYKTFWYPNTFHCPRLEEKMEENRLWCRNNIDHTHIHLKEKFLKAFNRNVNDVHWNYLTESMMCREAHNLDVPPGITQEDIKNLVKFTTHRIGIIHTKDRDTLRLAFGLPLYKLLENMKNEKGVFRIISAHDNTIMCLLLILLETTNLYWPPYVGNIIFETWETIKDNKKYIKILYNNDVIKINNKEYIELIELENKWKDIIVDEYNYWSLVCTCHPEFNHQSSLKNNEDSSPHLYTIQIPKFSKK